MSLPAPPFDVHPFDLTKARALLARTLHPGERADQRTHDLHRCLTAACDALDRACVAVERAAGWEQRLQSLLTCLEAHGTRVNDAVVFNADTFRTMITRASRSAGGGGGEEE